MSKSVREIVEEKLEIKKFERDKQEKSNISDKKRKLNDTFNRNVKLIINAFERNGFDLNAKEETVANFILKKRSINICGKDGFLSHPYDDKIGFFYDIWMELNETPPIDKDGIPYYRDIKSSKTFTNWKKAIEDKFGIEIHIGRDYEYGPERDEAPSDQYYIGTSACITLKE